MPRMWLLLLSLGIGICWASPRRFLMTFPHHNDHSPDVGHEITITASASWTSVTVQVLNSTFKKVLFLSAGQSKTVPLPSVVEMRGPRSSHLLSVLSREPVSVIASLCSQKACDHSLLHQVSSWGTHYYPVTPQLPDQSSVSQAVITSSDQETSVDVVLSGNVVFEGNLYPPSSVLRIHLAALESVQIQSNDGLSGAEIRSEKPVCVIVGYTCSEKTKENCVYGFSDLEPVSHWGLDYVIPPLTGSVETSYLLLALAAGNSQLVVTNGRWKSMISTHKSTLQMIPVNGSAEIRVTSTNPLQLAYFRQRTGSIGSFLVLRSVNELCPQTGGEVSEDLLSGGVSRRTQAQSSQDMGFYLSTVDREVYPAMCEKQAPGLCEELRCRPNERCDMKDGKPACSSDSRICSAWGGSYYRTFDGRDFVLQGSCNYTFLQNTCPNSKAHFPVQVQINRASTTSANTSHIYSVTVRIHSVNITLVRGEKHQVRIDGQKRNLPLVLENRTLRLYPSGSGVALETSFGLLLRYDWHSLLEVEVGPQLSGLLCGLCGNYNHNADDDFDVASLGGTEEAQAVAFVRQWRAGGGGACLEAVCVGAKCHTCDAAGPSQSPPESKGLGCGLLQSPVGPFAECHAHVGPDPYVHSCEADRCASDGAPPVVCGVMKAYADTCQRRGVAVSSWRAMVNCSMACPENSHYEACGSACPATCGNPEAPLGCYLPCEETCQCAPGYLLSGGQCVPADGCGCNPLGHNYLPRETRVMGPLCQQMCTCIRHIQVQCVDFTCPAGTECGIKNGRRDCYPPAPVAGMCTLTGGRHIKTYDGHSFDLHTGSCLYPLSQVSLMNGSDVVARIQQDQLHLTLHGVNLTLDWEQKGSVKVDGVSRKLPVRLGDVSVMQSGLSTQVAMQSGMVFTYGGPDAIQIIAPASYRGRTRGLCGNFNSDTADDARTPNSGTALGADGCVKTEKHGCFYQGHYYKLGETSWAKDCSERCRCSAPATMRCEAASCPEGASCALLNGSLGCVEKVPSCSDTKGPCRARKPSQPPQCWVLGGPHYHTFDGQTFDFHGNGTYTLVQSSTEPFWVRLQNHCAKNQASTLKAVHTMVYQDHITIQRGDKGCVWVNGQRRLLPVTLHAGLVRIHQRGLYAVMETGYGLQVKYDWSSHALVTLPGNHTDISGLCGNGDGNKDDDLRTPGGPTANAAAAFGRSWRLAHLEGSDAADCGAACPRNPAHQLQNVSEFLWSEHNPLRRCHSAVDPAAYYSAVRAGGDLCDQDVLCQALQAYNAACQDAGVQVGSWRNSTFCPMSCPANSHYESCGSACPASCARPSGTAPPCARPCVETCQCDRGFVPEGDACVPVARCGGGIRDVVLPHKGRKRRAVCNASSCGPDRYCGLRDGVLACLAYPWQACRYFDGHFSTFDRRAFNMRGDCRYQLVGTGGHRPGLSPIEVHIQTDGHPGSALHVLVKVNDTLVKMNSKDTERVEVNGVTRSMPYLLSSTSMVHAAGLYAYVLTDLGFTLTLSANTVVVELSEKYANATRGLCGNFNGDPDDDLTAAPSTNPLSPEQFGRAWRSEDDDPWCAEAVLRKCSSQQQLDLYSSAAACGKILEVDGPFRDCHGRVEPAGFYTNCVSDLCLAGELQPNPCRSLAEYAAVCRLQGAAVHAWRSPTFCHQTCPPGYFYTPGSSAPTLHCLGRLDATIALPATKGEDCRCEQGLVLSGALCVLPENCGCFYQGEYLRAGQEMSTCRQSCACLAGGRLACRYTSCGVEEECVIHKGAPRCQARPKEAHCSVDGGSRYAGFDGRPFEFGGSCSYTLAESGPAGLEEKPVEAFVVVLQGSQEGGREIYVRVKEMNITLSNKHHGKVKVNGVLENLPFSLSNVTVMQTGQLVAIQAVGSFQLSSDLHNHVLLKVPDPYRHATRGLCGNYNDDPSDDLLLPNRTLTSDPEAFGASWRRSDLPCSDRYASHPRPCHSLVPKYSSSLFCGLLNLPAGPFSPCHPDVPPRRYYASCMADLCAAASPRRPLCDALQAYEVACREKGVNVDPWRSNAGCAYQCPQFSHYQRCANACSSLCPAVARAVQCPVRCEEGCQCNPGYFYNGQSCVPGEKCGCVKNGRRFEASERRLLNNCTMMCHCGPPLVCEPHTCPAHHTCTLQDGVMGCQKKAVNDPCEGRCGPSAECVVRAGAAPRCVLPQGLCYFWGGSHYHTFDGLYFDLEGRCAYLLAASDRPSSLNPFTVSVKDGSRAASRAVTATAYGFNVTLTRARVQVNNLVIDTLPLRLLGGRLLVTPWEEGVLLRTDFGLQVFFGRDSDTLTVGLVKFYGGKVHGLCGNLNGDPWDDKGSAQTATDWTRAYRLGGQDPGYCDVESPLLQDWAPAPDDDAAAAELADDDYRRKCAALTDKTDRFGHCRVDAQSFYQGCVSDLARNAGAKMFLDQAMHSYLSICGQSDFVFISTFNEPTCPPNSHYENCGTACPESCESKPTVCILMCMQGCYCDSGFVEGPNGCVRREDCSTFNDSPCPSNSHYTTCGTACPETCESKPGICIAMCVQGCFCDSGFVKGPNGCIRREDCVPDPPCPSNSHYETCGTDCPETCESKPTFCNFMCVQGCFCDPGFVKGPNGCVRREDCTFNDSPCPPNSHYETCGTDCPETCKSKPTFCNMMCVQGCFCDPGFVEGPNGCVRREDCVPDLTCPSNSHYTTCGTACPETCESKPGICIMMCVKGCFCDSGFVKGPNGCIRREDCVPDPPCPSNSHYTTCGTACPETCASKPDFCMAPCMPWCSCDPGFVEGPNGCVRREDCVPDSPCPSNSHYDACGTACPESCTFKPGVCIKVCVEGCFCDTGFVQSPHGCVRREYCAFISTFNDSPCPPNNHYETCGTACPESCESKPGVCNKLCVKGCFCDPGFIQSPQGCVRPEQCGCTDAMGSYHGLNATFWTPEDCGQQCVCEPAGRRVRCVAAPCPRGQVCRQLLDRRTCQPSERLNCTLMGGLHFITFDGHPFDFRDACAYTLAEAGSDRAELVPFKVTVSDARCDNRLFHSVDLRLSVYGVEVSVGKNHPEKVLVDGLHKPLPYSHQTGHISAYRTPSYLVIQADFGLQLVLYRTGTIVVVLPATYGSAVRGLCGDANADPFDDQRTADGRLAPSAEEFAHSYRAAVACGPSCGSAPTPCGAEERVVFEDVDFCGMLLNELGPFEECAAALSPRAYFHACAADACAYAGHYAALCGAVASYAAACQAAGLPIRHWRSETFCAPSCPRNSHYELCGPRCPPTCAGLSTPPACSGACQEGCQCDPAHVLSDDRCVPASECGCVHDGQYYPPGDFYPGGDRDRCRKCHCAAGGEATCLTSACGRQEACSVEGGVAMCRPAAYGVCQVFGGFGYLTFDGLVLPHRGACAYVLSASEAPYNYSLILHFDQNQNGTIYRMSRLEFRLDGFELAVDPETLWKVQFNSEDFSLPFEMRDNITAFQDGGSLVVATTFGLRIELSPARHLLLKAPQDSGSAFSGLCGNLNGDPSDDLELPDGSLAGGAAEFLRGWTAPTPGHTCREEDCGGGACDRCTATPEATLACGVLMTGNDAFGDCRLRVEPRPYRELCVTAACGGAGHMEAVCLALEAYAGACRALGATVGPWRANTTCALQCPDRSGPSECVESGSGSCSAFLLPPPPAGSGPPACSEACRCLHGSVSDGGQCVPYSSCGCVHRGRYIKMDETLYSDDCTERCRCHPRGGALCDPTSCLPGERCVLRDGVRGCREQPGACELDGGAGGLRATTLGGLRLALEPLTAYGLVSLCDQASERWFAVVGYRGPCGGGGGASGNVTVLHVLLPEASVTIQEGAVKVDGHPVSLPHTLSSGVSLALGVSQQRSEVAVVLRRDPGEESELEVEVGVSAATVKLPLWYAGKLCGICGNRHTLLPETPVLSQVLPDFPGCGFDG